MSIREIGYGDATINKKMKEYVNLLFSIIEKIEKWDKYNDTKKLDILKYYIVNAKNYENYLKYIDKYRSFLIKNTFNNLTKDIINF